MDASLFLGLAGVKDAVPITRPYKLVSREFQPENTIVSVGTAAIGNGHMTLIAGTCAVESEKQALTIAEHVRQFAAPSFSGAGPSNRAHRPIPFRAWGKKAGNSRNRSGGHRPCRSSPR